MSLASCSYQCGFIEDNAMYTVALMAIGGDLYQRYSGDWNSPTIYGDKWGNTALGAGPILRVLLMESDPSVTQADLAQVVVDAETQYFIDGQRLVVGSDGISTKTEAGDTSYAGCFRKLLADKNGNATYVPTLASAPYGGLEIRKDLVTATGGKTINVLVKLALNTGKKGTYKQGSTNIRMIKVTGSTNFASIYCDANDSFVLEEGTNPDVVCKVKCWQGENEVTKFYRKWYILSGGAWVWKSDADTFTVHRDDVATFADVKVECYSDSDRKELITSDVQTINDSSDAYIVVPNPFPADGTFEQNGNIDVKFSPQLTDIDGKPATEAHEFIYAVLDAIGNIVQSNVDNNNNITVHVPQGGSFTVPAAVANSMGDGPIVNIEAVSK